jgi:hypothetical protein
MNPWTAAGFYLTAFVFIFGWGALALIRLGDDLPAPERLAIACGLGVAIAPLLMAVLAVCHAATLFAPASLAISGAMGVRWWVRRARPVPAVGSGDGRWYLFVGAAVFAIAAWASAGRLRMTGDTVAVFGDYETFDLTFYAGIASGLNNTTVFPPLSPFFAGHRIIYSYFPLLLLAGIHKVSGAPILQCFLWFGWPLFTSVAATTLFAFFRRLGSLPFAVLTTLLVFTGSGFAYLVPWLAASRVNSDTLIWAHLFLAPSSEWLYFNPWAPALIVLAAGLYAMTRLSEPGGRAWAVVAGFCFGQLFMFKSFGLPIVVAATGLTAIIHAWKRDPVWRRFAGVAAGTMLWAAPWVLAILPYNRLENRGARVTLQFLVLVRRMLRKLDLTEPLSQFVHRFIGSDPEYRIVLGIAVVIFLVGGLGMRCLGLGATVRAAIGRDPMRPWTPLAWIVILGVALPFVIDIAPFPNSMQTYEMAMFALWPFAVRRIWPPLARATSGRWIATALLVLGSVPATTHYVLMAHRAPAGKPLLQLESGGLQIIGQLRATDPSTTLLLQSDPLWASLYAIESERRVVLAWSGYVEEEGLPEVDALKAEIAAFFGSASASGTDDLTLLQRYRVTHVIERTAVDRIHPHVLQQLTLVVGGPEVRLYRVPVAAPR